MPKTRDHRGLVVRRLSTVLHIYVWRRGCSLVGDLAVGNALVVHGLGIFAVFFLVIVVRVVKSGESLGTLDDLLELLLSDSGDGLLRLRLLVLLRDVGVLRLVTLFILRVVLPSLGSDEFLVDLLGDLEHFRGDASLFEGLLVEELGLLAGDVVLLVRLHLLVLVKLLQSPRALDELDLVQPVHDVAPVAESIFELAEVLEHLLEVLLLGRRNQLECAELLDGREVGYARRRLTVDATFLGLTAPLAVLKLTESVANVVSLVLFGSGQKGALLESALELLGDALLGSLYGLLLFLVVAFGLHVELALAILGEALAQLNLLEERVGTNRGVLDGIRDLLELVDLILQGSRFLLSSLSDLTLLAFLLFLDALLLDSFSLLSLLSAALDTLLVLGLLLGFLFLAHSHLVLDTVHPLDVFDEHLLLVVLDEFAVVGVLQLVFLLVELVTVVALLLSSLVDLVQLLVEVLAHLTLSLDGLAHFLDLLHSGLDLGLDGREILADLLSFGVLRLDLGIDFVSLLDERQRLLDELLASNEVRLVLGRVNLALKLLGHTPETLVNEHLLIEFRVNLLDKLISSSGKLGLAFDGSILSAVNLSLLLSQLVHDL